MAEMFFNKFPVFQYDGATCKDITRRVGLAQQLVNLPTVFYAYDVPNAQRPDLTAFDYYEDPYLDWLIYLTNGILDSHYDWFLGPDDFQLFMADKYGDVDLTKQYTKYFQNNWADDDRMISPDFYRDNIPAVAKKYYEAYFGAGEGAKVIAYCRRKVDWLADTNMIVNFNVANAAAYTNTELLFTWGGGVMQGRSEVIAVYEGNNTLQTRHVLGNTVSNSSTGELHLAGWSSGANQVIVNTDVVCTVIGAEEFGFWAPVSVYDWEVQKNQSKKTVYLLDPGYTMQAAEELRVALANNEF
jgi:hypothetical protein